LVQITWYNSSIARGVSSDRRKIIVIGNAYKNVNRFDCHTQGDKEKSICKNHISNQASFYQLISRVKDPNAVANSIVFALGMTYEECVNGTTLGDRYIEITGPNTNDIKVVCNQYIDGPNIIKCANFNTMMREAIGHMYGENEDLTDSQFKLLNNFNCAQSCFETKGLDFQCQKPLNNTIRLQELKIQSNFSVGQLLQLISTAKTFSSLNSLEVEVMKHRHNKKVLKTCQVTAKGEAKTLTFGNMIEFNKNRLINLLNSLEIPYKVEQIRNKEDETYSVWIFLVPVKASKAKRFGEYIIDFFKDDISYSKREEIKFECTLYPEHIDVTTRKQYEIKMPLHNKSFVWVNGEYTNNFDTIDIEQVDLTNVDMDKFGKDIAAFKERVNQTTYQREYKAKRGKTHQTEPIEDELIEQAEWQRIVEASKIRLLLSNTEEQLTDWWDKVYIPPLYKNLLELSMAF